MKQAKIYMYNTFAGVLTEDENGYKFEYDSDYLASKKADRLSFFTCHIVTIIFKFIPVLILCHNSCKCVVHINFSLFHSPIKLVLSIGATPSCIPNNFNT